MPLRKMLLFTLLVLIGVSDIRSQPVSCVEDVQCMAGFFCVERTRSCHECLSCEDLGRSPSSIQNTCIKSGHQCGPCLQGLMNDAIWSGTCITPNTGRWKLLSFVWILLTCVATGALLSLVIVNGIHTLIIHADIIISSHPKVKDQTELTV